MNKAVFFDRDGVINNNANHYYIYKPEQLEINPDISLSISRLTKAGFLIIVVSNQGGISRGLYTINDVEVIHQFIRQQIEQEGGEIDDFYFCSHHSGIEKCLCRKPAPLLLQKAIARYNIDIKNSYLIGDSQRDIEAAQRVGINSFLLESNSSVREVVEEILTEDAQK